MNFCGRQFVSANRAKQPSEGNHNGRNTAPHTRTPRQVTPRTSQMYAYRDVCFCLYVKCVSLNFCGACMYVFLCVKGRAEQELWLSKSNKDKAMDEKRKMKM